MFECKTLEGKRNNDINDTIIITAIVADRARRRTRLSKSVKGNRPLTHDHENRDAPLARSSRTPLTLLRTMPAMPIDETVCRGSRRHRHHRRHRRRCYEPAAPLTQPRICLPRCCIHVCVCTCMHLRSTHSCVANISPHVCVNISTPLRYRKAEETRLPAIIESNLIKRCSWKCIGLHE